MFKSRIIYRIPPVDTQQNERRIKKQTYFAAMCEARWLSGADAEFSRVHSRDFHAVINDRPAQKKPRSGYSLCGYLEALSHLASPPEAKWLSDSNRLLRLSYAKLQPISVLSNLPINLFVTANSDSSSMTQCDELPPPHPHFCATKLIFRGLCVSIFHQNR